MADDGSDTDNGGVMDTISTYLYPAIRLILAGVAIWYSSGSSS